MKIQMRNSDVSRKLERRATARKIETNLIDYSLSYNRGSEGIIHEIGAVVWTYSGSPTAPFNRVLKASIKGEESEQIASTIACYQDRTASFWWIIGPSTKPADLSRHLLDAGLTSLGGFPGMALDLSILPSAWVVPESVTIRHLSHAEALANWSSIELTSAEPTHKASVHTAFARIPLSHAPEWFVAYRGKEPVCRCLTTIGSERDTVGLYILFTVPAETRQGIGSAVTWYALNDARSRGCKLSVLLASESGERLYRRFGFEEFCRFEYFVWNYVAS